jgi:N,N-dimethylformamidase
MGIDAAEAGRLAAEFRANPKGPHSPALQRLLNAMRGLPIAGKHILIFDASARDFVLGQVTGRRGAPVVRHATRFATVAAGEWHVFKLRLRALHDIEIDG